MRGSSGPGPAGRATLATVYMNYRTSPFATPAPALEPQVNKLAVSISEAALLVGVSPRTLWNVIARGELRPARLGRRRVLLVADLDEWLRAARA